MRMKMSLGVQASIRFIDEICEKEILGWPIDFESRHPSDKELAETFGYWFGGDKWAKAGDSFVQFGSDGTGSMFLLWYYPNLKFEPPVIFLGSEGESCLVASSIDEFIKQLASGKTFCDGNWEDPEAEDKDMLDWNQLKTVIENYIGSIELTPEQIQDSAIKAHPDLAKWVEAQVE